MYDPEASTSQKRTRAVSNEETDTTISERRFMPALPKVTSELLLQVFTDKSLGIPYSESEKLDESIYGDNQRLAAVGERVVDLAATHVAHLERPIDHTKDLDTRRGELISDGNLQHWAWHYKLRERVRCLPDVRASLGNPEETRNIFNAYCAAVYLECGIQMVTNWLYELTHDGKGAPGISDATREPRPQKRQRSLPTDETPSAPLPPAGPPAPNPLSPAQPDAPFLPLFNQAAASRKVTVDYPAEFIGSGGTGGWSVQCVVSGIAKGSGFGRTKQAAKEQAARSAYYAMGWQ